VSGVEHGAGTNERSNHADLQRFSSATNAPVHLHESRKDHAMKLESQVEYFQRLAKEQGVKTEYDPATNKLTVFGTIQLPSGPYPIKPD
jgi:hypothetical protein